MHIPEDSFNQIYQRQIATHKMTVDELYIRQIRIRQITMRKTAILIHSFFERSVHKIHLIKNAIYEILHLFAFIQFIVAAALFLC